METGVVEFKEMEAPTQGLQPSAETGLRIFPYVGAGCPGSPHLQLKDRGVYCDRSMTLEAADYGAEDLLPDGHLFGAKIPGALKVQRPNGSFSKSSFKNKTLNKIYAVARVAAANS